jgi:hypothetical protein
MFKIPKMGHLPNPVSTAKKITAKHHADLPLDPATKLDGNE